MLSSTDYSTQNLKYLKRNIYSIFKKFDKEKYPFTKDRTPYKVWIVEICLQQTKIETAIPKIKDLLSQFSSIKSLAQASEQEVLSAFSGLGYYNRARNLRKGAQYIITHFNGKLPQKYIQLLSIPSIGPYTAAAITSICFNQPVPTIDGNVKRIFKRLYNLHHLSSKNLHDILFQTLSQFLKENSEHSGDINEAIMQFGQTTCTSSTPKCQTCELSRICPYYNNLNISKVKINTPKTNQFLETNWFVFILQNPLQQIYIHKYTNFIFLKEQWGLPILSQITHTPHNTQTDCSIPTFQSQTSNYHLGKFTKLQIEHPKHCARFSINDMYNFQYALYRYIFSSAQIKKTSFLHYTGDLLIICPLNIALPNIKFHATSTNVNLI